jgi:hypothetical protein
MSRTSPAFLRIGAGAQHVSRVPQPVGVKTKALVDEIRPGATGGGPDGTSDALPKSTLPALFEGVENQF